MSQMLAGIKIPDSTLCKLATKIVREVENDLLFNHSSRVYCFAAIVGERKKLKYDSELLYIGAIFHDMGLASKYMSKTERFEVDGANVAAEFLRQHKISESDIEMVWDAIALHTTSGIPQHKKPVVALVTAGVEMDSLGIGFDQFSDSEREEVIKRFPRGPHFKDEIMRAFYNGIKDKPETTFGNVKGDVIAHFDPKFKPINFCEVILKSKWPT
jgi:hypothetical protein